MKQASNVFYRHPDASVPTAVKAEGNWIIDASGKRYLDASGGAIVVNLGQGRQEVANEVYKQLLHLWYAHPTMFDTKTVEKLAKKLADHAPEGISRFYFMTTGSEAIETAIKLARQVHMAKGRESKWQVISRWKSYHGLSVGALSVAGRTCFRTPYTQMLFSVEHISPPYCLRCSYGLSYPKCDVRCASALEDAILNLGPETVSAFVAETVSGATLAAAVPPTEYWSRISNICKKYDVLLVLDEVMVGMGRTGKWFACEHFGISPDIIVLGKGLSGGSLPLSAIGTKEEHYQAIMAMGGFNHGGTFSHHPVTAAAGLATINILERDNLIERVSKMGRMLKKNLDQALGNHPNVGDIRGIGLLWGVELVENRETLKPFPRGQKITEKLWHLLFKKGVILYKSVGLAGRDGDALVIGPPFTIKPQEIEYLVSTLKDSLTQVLKEF